MTLSRRGFLKSSGLAMIGFGACPAFLSRAAFAAPSSNKKVLVSLFLRGGADGLSVLPPVGDPDYYKLRPTLAIKPPGDGDRPALKLDGNFGMHPSLAPLYPLWQAGTLAFVHAAGQANPTRSHFDAQDFMESGSPGVRTSDGWLNRTLQVLPPDPSAFRAVAVQPRLPFSLVGPAPALSVGSVEDFQIRAGGFSQAASRGFESLYAGAVDEALRHTGDEAFEALHQVSENKIGQLPAQNGAVYPKSPLGKRLQDIARLIHADVGLQVAATEIGGWDTHIAQGADAGQLAGHLKDLGESLAAFATDLGSQLSNVCVIAMTEFGRTARENGNRGTDHGTGSAMLALGGSVKGGRVLGNWPGLRADQLFEGRDLKVTTDFRAGLGEAMQGHLGVPVGAPIFPGYPLQSAPRVGLFT